MKRRSKEDIANINKIASLNEHKVLKVLGFSDIYEYGIKQCCPIHKGDNSSAFSYDTKRHCWSCFTRHCEQKYGNDILGLVRGIKKYSFNQSIEWLEKLLIEGKEVDWGKIDKEYESQEQKEDVLAPNPIIDEGKLANLVKDYSSLDDRGYKRETLEYFEGGLSLNGKGYDHRFMIPIRNITGGIVGFTGRSIYDECEICSTYHNQKKCPSEKFIHLYSKWRHYPTKGFKKSLELYNIDKAKDTITKTNTCLIVEGPFDVWTLWEQGIYNVVATLGISISSPQISMLKSLSCHNLVLIYDTDEAGIKATKRVTEIASKHFKVYIPNLPTNIDPGEMNANQCNQYIKGFIKTI